MKPLKLRAFFLIVEFDGINLGIRDCWNETWLEFNEQDAFDIREHWLNWIYNHDERGKGD